MPSDSLNSHIATEQKTEMTAHGLPDQFGPGTRSSKEVPTGRWSLPKPSLLVDGRPEPPAGSLFAVAAELDPSAGLSLRLAIRTSIRQSLRRGPWT